MRSFKAELVDWVQSLPEDCTLDDVEAFVRVRREVESGMADLADGGVAPEEEVRRRVAEWLASFGQGVP